MTETPKYHPALTITNVKTLVPVTLDNEQSLYHSWPTLFTNLARVYDLYDHVVPPTDATAGATYETRKSEDLSLWNRLDAVLLHWIYDTISFDLLLAILCRNDTAKAAWNRLESLFQDNKASRATHLEEDFTNADFEDFTSIDNYCNYLQSIADRLVLRLTGSLPEAYNGTVDYIQNQDPMPSFKSCRSRLKTAERTIKARTARENGGSGSKNTTPMVAASNSCDSAPPYSKRGSNNKPRHNKNKGKGKGPHPQTGPNTSEQQPAWHPRGPSLQAPMWQHHSWPGWSVPPCPFPAYTWRPRPMNSAQQHPSHGLLGPRSQSYNAMTSSSAPQSTGYTPTDIEAAMHALSFAQSDGNYYMDTGATSHMTADSGILSSYFNSSNKYHNIVVGSGHLIPVIGHGCT
ncbi:uncharacterized protein LOC104894999 [Beta vulgaris subsp. vulgaris]|uniref:uncharacterized protein LOC104894999 n=1 Tax=Beta vulgaris subsp. vulgaris TaxID=3555 RepID=UPI00053FD859|nr:uncharacterized protein LOC104894999 [Beta vulgaris subsp. vulgaris]